MSEVPECDTKDAALAEVETTHSSDLEDDTDLDEGDYVLESEGEDEDAAVIGEPESPAEIVPMPEPEPESEPELEPEPEQVVTEPEDTSQYWPQQRLNSKDMRNMYEIERDIWHVERDAAGQSHLMTALGNDLFNTIMDFLAPYACTVQPYYNEFRDDTAAMLEMLRFHGPHLGHTVLNLVSEYMQPLILISEPIPCAITTIGMIRDFDYKQDILMKAIKARGRLGLIDRRILAVVNTTGVWVRPGIEDPRAKHVSKHGRPVKNAGYRLFGTSQTTFWVKTYHRTATKVFAIKVFQRNVNFETLGGLWVDCRDTRDVNSIVLTEIRACLDRPDIDITEFSASMRNYRFRLLGNQQVNMRRIYDIFREMRATRPEIFCDLDIKRYPSVIIAIDEPNHTSKKKQITIKIFQSGKVNLDSCVFPEHVEYWYRFINDFFINHPDVVYTPAQTDGYDSDYYYHLLGVNPPPRELVEC